MNMRLVVALMGLSISLALPTIAQEQNTVDPEVRQQIEALLVKFDDAFNKNDLAAIMTFYTQDAVLMMSCYLDISQRSVDPASFWSDSLPNEFSQIQMEVQGCLRDFNKSVSGVILLWKDHIILRMNDGGALCLHRYRSVLIRHMNPNEPLPEDTERIMVGNTVMLPVVAGDGS